MLDMFLHHELNSVKIDFLPASITNGLPVGVLRLDLLHPQVSGNKWFKLQFYLEQALKQQKQIVTFGGAWSNHLLATAIACEHFRIPCTAIVRGEQPPVLSQTLTQAREAGMNLLFISRKCYASKQLPPEVDEKEFIIVPEGGAGPLGIKGAGTITGFADDSFTHWLCATGTGTTMGGLISKLGPQQRVTGIPVLQNIGEVQRVLLPLQSASTASYQVLPGFEFGGYAKYNSELTTFMNWFNQVTSIPTDFVYTGKLFYACMRLIADGHFKGNEKVLVVHSGGLQGNAGLPPGTLMF